MHLNEIYNELTRVVHTVLDGCVPYKDVSPRLRRSGKRGRSRPYWNDELKQLWVSACAAERAYLKHKGTLTRRSSLKAVLKTFDKRLRQAERPYIWQISVKSSVGTSTMILVNSGIN